MLKYGEAVVEFMIMKCVTLLGDKEQYQISGRRQLLCSCIKVIVVKMREISMFSVLSTIITFYLLIYLLYLISSSLTVGLL